ncbi:MAG: hypothetical protein JNN27_06975 [Planctomycetes bacterium]|nr:hypothetical protein [Planctomycetota bacterium]
MFDAWLTYLRNAGALGLGALLVGLLLLSVGVVMLDGRSTRSQFAWFLALALLPLALGAIGAAAGHSTIDNVLAAGGAAAPAEIERGRVSAAIPLEIGAAFTGLLLIVGLIGILLAGDPRSADGAATAN